MSSAATIAIPTGYAPLPVHAFSRNLDSPTASHTAPTVFIVDDDIDIRQSLELLIRSQGWQPLICDSAHDFLAQPRSCGPSSMILAFSSTDSNGLEVQKRIARECAQTPIIVLADRGDTSTAVRAMKAGAFDFLVKPFNAEPLVAAIRQSLVRSRAALERCRELHDLRSCYALLSPREQQVMALVASGLLNKQAGVELGISEITIKAHRGQVMQKMKASSFAHLVNMASKLRLPKPMMPAAI
jgi:FixJ family two-component response regulator